MAGQLGRGEVRLYRSSPEQKQRPVVVLTSDTAIPYLTRVTVAPITSTVRGVPSEVALDIEDGMKGRCVVNLHNVITVEQRNLGARVAILDSRNMNRVCQALAFALNCGA
jgi:mRNA interferase MazF